MSTRVHAGPHLVLAVLGALVALEAADPADPLTRRSFCVRIDDGERFSVVFGPKIALYSDNGFGWLGCGPLTPSTTPPPVLDGDASGAGQPFSFNVGWQLPVRGALVVDSISGTIGTGEAMRRFAGVAGTADEVADALARRVRELMAAHHPTEAIDLCLELIDGGRYDLPRSAPALVELVRAFQMLKDDPAWATRYATTVGRYLADRPPLDGASLPTLVEAREALAWQAWLTADLALSKPTATRVRRSLLHDDGRTCVSFSIADVPTGFATCYQTATLTVTTPMGQPDQRSPCLTGAFNPLFQPTSGSRSLSCDVSLSSVARDARTIPELAGAIEVVAAMDWQDTRIPLRVGESWTRDPATYRIEAFDTVGDDVSIVVSATDTTATAETAAPSMKFAFDAPCSQEMAGSEYSWQVGKGTLARWKLKTTCVTPPTALIQRCVTATSTRRIPFRFVDVPLP